MKPRYALATACSLLTLAVAASPAFSADARLAGIWLPDASRSQRMPPNPPYTAEGRRIVDDWRATHDPVEDDPGAFCQAPGMPSLALGGADYPLEIIVQPEQVTILMELHQQNRRIFMDLDEHPARPFPQRNGHSIGQWDGDTLVVDTTVIRGITFGSVPHSDQVHVTERWNVIDNGESVVNELTVTDPIMYAEPIVLRQFYTRAEPGTRMLEYECTEGMWEDHERERERRQRGQSAQPPIPRYDVHRAPSAITVDGDLSDAAWSAAAPAVSLQFLWDDQTGARQETSVRLLWDQNALYVAYAADDADITARFMNRDDPTYRDDALEIFINPNPAQETIYYGFEVNALGTLYDYLEYQPRTFFARFDATNLQIGVAHDGTLNERDDTDTGWTLELAIPWENFAALSRRRPGNGTVWKANLNRWDGVEPDRRMSIWSDPMNDESWPHEPARFGELVFVE